MEFSAWRARCLADQPALLDCSETNVYRALEYLRPKSATLRSSTPHRCDLARAWLQRYDFPAEWSRRALVCRGVRHALSLLFGHKFGKERSWWIPADAYPVYLELARAAAIETRVYTTLPAPALPLNGEEHLQEAILLPNPWKPLGRFLTDEECDALIEWLAASDSRYAVVDCAYDLTMPLHQTTRRLCESGKAIVLHTFTKGWLSPKMFGIALAPEHLRMELEGIFRADAPSDEQLNWADDCLSRCSLLPAQVADDLDRRRTTLLETLPAEIRKQLVLRQHEPAAGCYFFPLELTADVLIGDYGTLAIPATAFGGPSNWSVLTSLDSRFRNGL